MPALFLTGLYLGDKTEEALNDAKSNRDQAQLYVQKVANQFRNLDDKFRPLISDMDDIIYQAGTNYRNYSY